MTGKQLKAFAALLPDNALIEVRHYSWDTLKPRDIRATIEPLIELQDVCNLEDAESNQ